MLSAMSPCFSSLFPSIPRLFIHANPLSVLGGARQKWASWHYPTKLEKLDALFTLDFSLWEKLQAE